jgi:hypothetical protein
MQQQQCLRVRRARFAIENIEALDIGLPKADLCMTGLNDPRTPLTAVYIRQERFGPSSASQEVGFGGAEAQRMR